MTFNKLFFTNLSKCPICITRNVTFYQCSRCKYKLCINCYGMYFNEYNFNNCPHCRLDIYIVSDNTNNRGEINRKECYLNNYLECLLRFIFTSILIVICYFLGFIITNKHYPFPMINIMYGFIGLLVFLIFMFSILTIFRQLFKLCI